MVAKTRKEIEEEHTANAQNIRASYHDRHKISHEEYHNQLNAENEKYEVKLATNFPPEPVRDLEAEIDDLRARLDKIEV